MAEIISGVYKIINIITGNFYIGSSKNVKQRWAYHKCHSAWKNNPNKQLYKDMQKYGLDYFEFQIVAEVEPEHLKETEQKFIEKLKPIYNDINAKGLDIERIKKHKKEYEKKYQKSYKSKEYKKEYNNQICCYNDEKLTLCALASRFRKSGVEHPVIEAKKYLVL